MATVDEYRAALVRQNKTDATVKAYAGCVEQLQRWAGKPIEEVTVDDTAAWLRRPHLRQASRNTYHRWLAAYCDWSGHDLIGDVKRAPRPPAAPKPVPPERVGMMLAACRDDQELALVLLPLLAGLRRAETACFSGDQLDAAERMILVRGKGGVDAWVPAPPALVRLAGRMPPRRYWFPSPGRAGVCVSPFTVWRRTVDLSERAGAGHVPPHRLRHTYGTELVRGGVALTSVQRCMRHASIGTTAMYIGVSPSDLHDAAAVLPWAA